MTVVSKESTPLMQQYREIKARHKDAILFFRMGDFYEMFYDDAELASRLLGLTLTARNNGGAAEVPLAGVPVKAMHEYLRRLVRHGHRVAICEQVEDPKLAKGIVRREVVETITPGAAFSDDLLETGRNNFLCAVRPANGRLGLAHLLEQDDPPSAVFAAGEVLALGALKEAQARHLDVPAQLALCGYTDSPTATLVQPPLTMVAVPAHEIGTRAMQRLADLIQGKTIRPRRTILPVELILRESCGHH